MKRTLYFPYFLLILLLFLLLNFPQKTSNFLRSKVVSYVYPTFQFSGFIRSFVLTAPTLYSYQNKAPNDEQIQKLLLENHSLKAQINAVYEWLVFDGRIEDQAQRVKALKTSDHTQGEIYWRDFFQRRSEELKNLIEMKTQALPAKVIYRQPSSWSSSLWIDVGQEDNEKLGREIVSPDSPVVVGNSLIGVVEFVDQNRSRVRLITDSGLVPSVRALRGRTQDSELAELLSAAISRIKSRESIASEDEVKTIELIMKRLNLSGKDLRLAKGELHGSSEPLWRVNSEVLKGVGFNYNYSDIDGPARDLTTGAPLEQEGERIPILQKGDLLVTTGMDGVFPPGLHVAYVIEVHDLKSGDYAYNLEARPSFTHIHDLTSVFVIPKLIPSAAQ